MAVDMSRFRSLNAMPASGHDRVVELHFRNLEGVSLYAHSCMLSNWSRVLANVIEDSHSTQQDSHSAAAQQQDSHSAAAAAAAAAGPVRHQTIPLDDADCSAWEDALGLMYPAVPLFQVTWDNAARLLLLADKYDMPAVAEHVRLFLDTPREAFAPAAAAAAAATAAAGPLRLEAQLTSGSTPGLPDVFEWLQVTSKCGLEQHAQTCIQHIIQQKLQLPAGLISNIQPQHSEALFNAMQQALQRAQALLQQAAVPSQAYRCACCGNRWFQLPGTGHQPPRTLREEQQAAACVHCGEDVNQLHHGEDAPAGLAAGAVDAGMLPFSESLGTTEDGSDEGDTDDEGEGEGDAGDEPMSQDSNSESDDEDDDDEDDDMAGSADGAEDDDNSSGSSSEGDTDDSSSEGSD